MKKLILTIALCAGFSALAYAGYDISTESFPDADNPTRPYSVTASGLT